MSTWKILTVMLFVGALILPGLATAPATGSPVPVALAQVECPPQAELEALQTDLDALYVQLVPIRAYKDATITQLARTNSTYYSFDAELERAQEVREALLQERTDLLMDGVLDAEEAIRLQEIEDELFGLSILMTGANARAEEQLDVVSILWRPVIDVTEGVSVERYERYTQRILEVRVGAVALLIEDQAALLEQYAACLEIVPEASGIGAGQ